MTRFASLALLAVLVVWSVRNANGEVGWGAFEQDPSAFDGVARVASLFRVIEVGKGQMRLSKGGVDLTVTPASADVSVGDDVSVGGRFDAKSGVFVAEWVEVAHGRTGKKLLSLLGLAAVALWIPRVVRRTPLGWEIRG